MSSSCADEPAGDFGDYSIILPPDPPIFGVSHFVPRSIPNYIERPPYSKPGRCNDLPIDSTMDPHVTDPYSGDGKIKLGCADELNLRRAARLAKIVLNKASDLVKVGVSTDVIDRALHEFIISHDAYPSPLHYAGFPRSCCTSVNNIVVHGIPDDRLLEDGDIVNVDVTVYLKGFHGDTSKTFLVGNVDSLGRALVRATEEALHAAIEICRPGRPFKDIGTVIEGVASKHGFCVSSQFTGHGIGKVFHRPPWIVHARNEEPGLMEPGQCFTIEPCLIQGDNPQAWIFPDGWTASTVNGARSAQAEHMILITDAGADILT